MTTTNASLARMPTLQGPPAALVFACAGPAQVHPTTGLCTDYLNHFNEAIMLLEMAPSFPDAIGEFLAWEPLSYRGHFLQSKLADRSALVTAYDNVDPRIRRRLEALADTMTIILMTARAVLQIEPPRETLAAVARVAVGSLKPLVARAGAVINGAVGADDDLVTPQDVVDALMER